MPYSDEVLARNRAEFPDNPFYGLDNVMLRDADEVIEPTTVDQVFVSLKDYAFIGIESEYKKGELYKYAVAQMDQDDLARREYREGTSGKSLGHFADDQDGETDIYEQYIAESKATKENPINQLKNKIEREADFQRLEREAREAVLTEPTFEEFFDKEAEGKYAFDNTSSVDYERTQAEEEFQRIQEDEESESLYRRELLARLYGGKLTARQLQVLLQMSPDKEEHEAINKAAEFTGERDSRDNIRNAEEIIESHRRRQVILGKWSEHESHRLLQD